jgi:hypothetical protein
MGIGRPRDLEKQRFWGVQLRACLESGLTQAEFCRRQGFGINTFTTWKRRLRLREMEPVEDLGIADCGPGESPVRLVPVRIRPDVEVPAFVTSPAACLSASLTLVAGDGYRIEVGDGFAPATLARLLATLARL